MPSPLFALDDTVMRLLAEAEGADPDKTLEAYHRELAEQAEDDLAAWRRRDRQPGVEWALGGAHVKGSRLPRWKNSSTGCSPKCTKAASRPIKKGRR